MNMRVGAAAILIISHHLLIEETTWLHIMITSQWRHIGISNHQEIDCLFNRFHKENVKVSRYWPFVRCPAGYCVFTSHRANNTESVSMSGRHHGWGDCPIKACFSTQKTYPAPIYCGRSAMSAVGHDVTVSIFFDSLSYLQVPLLLTWMNFNPSLDI